MVEIAILSETKTTDINAGTFTSGSWIVRLLNNLVSNQTTGWISLNTITGAFTLKSGKYLIQVSAPAVGVNTHQARIHNTTDNTSIMGSSSLSYALTPSNSSFSIVQGYINITANKTFNIEHFCTKTTLNFGLGFASGIPGNTEVYTQVTITKL